MTEYERGFEQGKQSVQPHWISVEERLPERNGDYFAVSESLNDYPIGPKGSVCAGWATFTDGRWEDDMYDSWKMICMTVGRSSIGLNRYSTSFLPSFPAVYG